MSFSGSCSNQARKALVAYSLANSSVKLVRDSVRYRSITSTGICTDGSSEPSACSLVVFLLGCPLPSSLLGTRVRAVRPVDKAGLLTTICVRMSTWILLEG
jgi:hypothetical protein